VADAVIEARFFTMFYRRYPPNPDYS
jgi:hypothetical protein